MASKDNFKVIIIGAGVTGLSLAHGLGKRNIPYEIFEKYPEGTRTRDWGITVHWAVEFLSLYPPEMEAKLRTAQVNPHKDYRDEEYVFFYNGATKDILKRVPLGPAKRFSPLKIRNLLTEGIDVQYGKALKSYETTNEGVTVHFEEGSSTSGSILVGCDGGGSYTRGLAEQAREIQDGVSAFLDVAVHPNSSYFGLVPLDMSDLERPETWKFQIFLALKNDLKPEEDSSAKRMALVKEAGKHFCQPFRSAIEWLPEDTPIILDRYGTWESRAWDSVGGKLLLAGDSAHAMTAHRAQGLNHALQDILNLIRGVEEVRSGSTSLKDFGEKYVEEVVERGSEEVRMSLKQGLSVHNWEAVRDMPIMTIGATPLHRDDSVVPMPA